MNAERPRRSWWYRLSLRFASSRPGVWFYARTLHHVDRLTLRLSGGRHTLTGLVAGLPIVWLTTTGVKSGQPRTVPLVGIEDGERVVLIASNYGQAHHPAWYYNLRARPEATLVVRGRTMPVMAREATGEEYDAYWRRAVALYPGWISYRRYAGARRLPMVILTPRTP